MVSLAYEGSALNVIYSFVYISINSWILILFNGLQSVTIINSLDAQIVPGLAAGSPFKLAFLLLSALTFWGHFLILWH